MSKRYFTYLNDQSVPGRVLVDASIGYRFGEGTGMFHGFAIEGSVTNLTDKKYYSSISYDHNYYGAPRNYLLTVQYRM